ncbi:MAG: ABC transporter ATP-binding protein [Candidatus Poribacteria bacterium]
MSANNPIIIQFEKLCKSFRDNNGTQIVLNNLSANVRLGEFVTIVGPSGCGKTTLFNLILGSEEPTSGRVVMEGKQVTSPNRDRGVVFQRYSLFPHMTVLQNIVFGLEIQEFNLISRWFRPFLYAKKRREYKEQAMDYLNRINLIEHADKYPYQLSGGMRQRVAIAQALITNPKILLMDEPFGALDNQTREQMQRFILEQWQQRNMTIFFVTHDTEEALYLATRIWVLSPYYENAEGSKIVIDHAVPGPHPKPDSAKYTDWFTDMLARLRKEGLDRTYLQSIREFDLSHPDAGKP